MTQPTNATAERLRMALETLKGLWDFSGADCSFHAAVNGADFLAFQRLTRQPVESSASDRVVIEGGKKMIETVQTETIAVRASNGLPPFSDDFRAMVFKVVTSKTTTVEIPKSPTAGYASDLGDEQPDETEYQIRTFEKIKFDDRPANVHKPQSAQ